MARNSEPQAKAAPTGGARGRRGATRATRQTGRAAGAARTVRTRAADAGATESRSYSQQTATGETKQAMADNKISQMNQVSVDLAQTLRETYQTVVESAVAAQERNVKFAQSVFETSVDELRSQSETARAVWQALAAQSEKQREAFQTLAHESMDAYMEFFTSPLSFYRKGWEAMQEAAQRLGEQPGI
jgi:hypothetical protein